jgi:DNA-binding NtrC family response regulator
MHTDNLVHCPRVLIVEDEGRLRDLLVEEIGDMGFAARSVRSGEEARRIMSEDPHEIIVLDLHLPGMGGMELFEQVRVNWPAAQVVILTGYGELEAARRAIHLDVVDFLSKPCRMKELETALDRARRRITGSSVEAQEREAGKPGEVAPLKQSEREQIIAALVKHGGNRTAAALALGISRRTLHYRLREYRKQGFELE